MTDKELNDSIDKVIGLLKKSDTIDTNKQLLILARDGVDLNLIGVRMTEFGLIKVFNMATHQTWELTSFGRKVLRFDSWTDYTKHIHDKEINDAKNSAYLTKTRWWPLGISAVGLIISIISLTRTCNNKEQLETELDSQTKGLEIINGDSPQTDQKITTPIDSLYNLKPDSSSNIK